MAKKIHLYCGQCGTLLDGATCKACGFVNNLVAMQTASETGKRNIVSVIKYEGDTDTLVWKHPVEDFHLGSQLVVHESQQAVFFREGQALDAFGAGRHTLKTLNLPLVDKLISLVNHTESPFHCEVYFVNLVHQMAIKWGTPEKINFLEPITGAPMSIGARGELNFKIADAKKLLLKLVGTGSKLTRQELMSDGDGPIKNYFRSLIQLTVSTNLANIITAEKLDILQLDQQKMRLSAAMLNALQDSFGEYGLVITEFLITGIALPQSGELGYDALQTILQMRKKDLEKSRIETETEIKLAEMEAKKQLDIRIQENVAEVQAARKTAVTQKGEADVLEAQYASKAKVAVASGDVEIERMRAQMEAEEMRLKGYSQKDVIQADVQKAYAGALGEMGANGGGGGGSMLGDVASLGVTLGAMGSVIGMTKDAMAPMTQMGAPAAAPAAAGWNCTCGQQNIVTNFCPNCGSKKPEPQTGWSCTCGQQNVTSNFCPNCGAKKPAPEAGWDCACGQQNITSNFCPNCGAKKPAAEAGWDCACGQKEIKSNFCPNCGNKKA